MAARRRQVEPAAGLAGRRAERAVGRVGELDERDHGREPHLRRDRDRRQRDGLPRPDQGRAGGLRRRIRRLQSDPSERRVCQGARAAGARRARHVDGIADLGPAGHRAAGGRDRLYAAGPAVPCAGVSGRRGDGYGHRDRQGGGRQSRALRLPLHRPGRQAGARRHGRGARADGAGRDAGGQSADLQRADPRYLRGAAAACGGDPGGRLRGRVPVRRQLAARGRRGGRGRPDRSHPGRPRGQNPTDGAGARDRPFRLRDRRRGRCPRGGRARSNWCGAARPCC